MSLWTIEQWNQLQINYDKGLENPKNRIVFDDKQVYKTIYLPWKEFYEDKREKDTPRTNKSLLLENDMNKRNEIPLKTIVKKAPSTVKRVSNIKKGGLLEEWQYAHLRKEFKRCQFPDTFHIDSIGYSLGISPDKVRNWFQNQRAKIRREKSFFES